jgi:hypothetical protein
LVSSGIGTIQAAWASSHSDALSKLRLWHAARLLQTGACRNARGRGFRMSSGALRGRVTATHNPGQCASCRDRLPP